MFTYFFHVTRLVKIIFKRSVYTVQYVRQYDEREQSFVSGGY